jgi:hypothetical protein
MHHPLSPQLKKQALYWARTLTPFLIELDEGRRTLDEVSQIYRKEFRFSVDEVAKSANRAGSPEDVSFIVASGEPFVNRSHLAKTINALAGIAGDPTAEVSLMP